MCIGAVAVEVHPDYPLVFVFNRDEAFERPAEPLHFWSAPFTDVVAGRDTLGKGTWLAVSRQGQFAAILNYWESGNEKVRQATHTVQMGTQEGGFMTRGEIPLRLAASGRDIGGVAEDMWRHRNQYKSFNLIYGSMKERKVWHCSHNYSARLQGIEQVSTPLFSVSNTSHEVKWEKTEKLKKSLYEFLSSHGNVVPGELVTILADRSYAVPVPGVHPEENSIFVPTFMKEINGQVYTKGTVCSTVVLLDRHNTLTVLERSFSLQQTEHSDVLQQFQLSVTESL